MTDLVGNPVTESTHTVRLTPAAVEKAKYYMALEQRDDLRLRLHVEAGGCSGFRYDMRFDDQQHDGDAVVDFDGVELVVNRKVAPYVDGAEIDYADTIHNSGFQMNNPSAVNTCACGDSFN